MCCFFVLDWTVDIAMLAPESQTRNGRPLMWASIAVARGMMEWNEMNYLGKSVQGFKELMHACYDDDPTWTI